MIVEVLVFWGDCREALVADIVQSCGLERATGAVDAALQCVIQMAASPALQVLPVLFYLSITDPILLHVFANCCMSLDCKVQLEPLCLKAPIQKGGDAETSRPHLYESVKEALLIMAVGCLRTGANVEGGHAGIRGAAALQLRCHP